MLCARARETALVNAFSWLRPFHFRSVAQRELQDLRAIDLRHCPSCNAVIQKNGGCPQMRCPCGHRFAWHSARRVTFEADHEGGVHWPTPTPSAGQPRDRPERGAASRRRTIQQGGLRALRTVPAVVGIVGSSAIGGLAFAGVVIGGYVLLIGAAGAGVAAITRLRPLGWTLAFGALCWCVISGGMVPAVLGAAKFGLEAGAMLGVGACLWRLAGSA